MILFTADWHIKLGQKNVPVAWALDRYDSYFSQLSELEKECDLHIIGGDLFDRMPSILELQVYFKYVVGVTIPTIIYDGNHEATRKNQTFFTALKDVTKKLNPLVTVVDTTYEEDRFTILPYCDLHRKGFIETLDTTKPVFTHVRGEIPPHVKPEVDLDRFSKFPVVFAGDLHSHSNTQKNIVYPGSPMTTSFHRSEVKTGCLLINEEDFSWVWREFKLPQLIRKTISDVADMIPTKFHHTIYEVEGDMQDLANMENSDILDKKLVKRNSEAALVITKEMSIEDELSEYLLYILELPEDKISEILGTFNDNIKDAELE